MLMMAAAAASVVVFGAGVAVSMEGGGVVSGTGSVPKSATSPKSSDGTDTSVADAGGDVSGWEKVARSVVYIEAQGASCGWSGSGSIVGDGSYVLTNQHVSGNGECDLSVWLTDSTSTAPTRQLHAEIVLADENRDLAVIRMLDTSGAPFVDPTRIPVKLATGLPKLGDKITILGYPGLGGTTITLTSGDFSGIDSSENFDYLKTTANMNPGVSGGAALNAKGELVGIPTAGRGAAIDCGNSSDCVANGSTIGLLRPASLAREVLGKALS